MSSIEEEEGPELESLKDVPSTPWELTDFTSNLEFAAHIMGLYVCGEMTEPVIPIFDNVYHDYILWPAIFFDRPPLQLPHPRRFGEHFHKTIDRYPMFWKEYIEQVAKIIDLKPCKVVPHRIFISKTRYVAETPLGFYYPKKPNTFGIYFAPKNETDPIVLANLVRFRDAPEPLDISIDTEKGEDEEGEEEDQSNAPRYTVKIEDHPPRNGTYNHVKRNDGKFERVCLGQTH